MKKAKLYFKNFRHTLRLKKTKILSSKLVDQVRKIIPNITDIPVIVVSYNNGVYVHNMCKQLNKLNIKPVVIDNNSNDKKTLATLNGLSERGNAFIAYSSYNFGHGVGFIEPVYKLLPDIFAYTDPDLQLNDNLPKNFLDILAMLTDRYSTFKAGFALSLDINKPLKKTKFHSIHYKPIFFEKNLSIREFESKYWKFKLDDDEFEIYTAPIDTTFAVYRKENYTGDFHHAIRVANNFSAIHLPWFDDIDILDSNDKTSYLKNNKSSNWV